jgi:hypothetical protein
MRGGMRIDQTIRRADLVTWAAGEAAKSVTLQPMDRAYLGTLAALMSANPWLSNEPDEAVTVRELDNALVGLNTFVDVDALNSQIATLNAQIAALQAVDYQLAASDELIKTAFTFRAFKANYYNATAKVTSGAVTRAISNYRAAAASGTVTAGTDGLTVGINARLWLSANIGTENIDFHSWVRITRTSQFTDIFGLSTSLASSYLYHDYFSPTQSRLRVTSEANTTVGTYRNDIDNTWFYLQVTRVGTTMNVYVNGALYITKTVTNLSYSNAYIGYTGANGNNTRIYNSAELIIGGAAAQITSLPARE